MFRIETEKNLVNLVNPVEKDPPQAAKFPFVITPTLQKSEHFRAAAARVKPRISPLLGTGLGNNAD